MVSHTYTAVPLSDEPTEDAAMEVETTVVAAPPSYDAFEKATLPTYDDAVKGEEAAGVVVNRGGSSSAGTVLYPVAATMTYELAGSDSEDESSESEESGTALSGFRRRQYAVLQTLTRSGSSAEQLLGNNLHFGVCFGIAFALGWLGFIISFCFTPTIAGRSGATSGLGLYLVTLAFSIRNYAHYYATHAAAMGHITEERREQIVYFQTHGTGLLILFYVLGALMFAQGFVMYHRKRKELAHLQQAAQRHA